MRFAFAGASKHWKPFCRTLREINLATSVHYVIFCLRDSICWSRMTKEARFAYTRCVHSSLSKQIDISLRCRQGDLRFGLIIRVETKNSRWEYAREMKMKPWRSLGVDASSMFRRLVAIGAFADMTPRKWLYKCSFEALNILDFRSRASLIERFHSNSDKINQSKTWFRIQAHACQ